MLLYLDGELWGETRDKNEMVDKINELIQKSRSNSRVIKHCYVNGQEIQDLKEDLPALLKSNKIEKIELKSIDEKELAIETLHTALEYLDNMTSYVKKLNEELGEGGTYEKSSFMNLIDGLEWLYNVSYNLSSYLKNEKLENMTDKLTSNFNKINESLESGDLPAFRDVLQDELFVSLEELKPIFKEELAGLENKRG